MLYSDETLVGIVERIQSGEESGAVELYEIVQRGMRYLMRRGGVATDDIDDQLHKVFITLLGCIRNAEIREPRALLGYALTVTRRQIASYREELQRNRRQAIGHEELAGEDPERDLLVKERAELIQDAFRRIGSREREVLLRFYLLDQKPPEICAALHMTEGQLRNMKHRAKKRVVDMIARKERVARLRHLFAA